MTRMAWAAVLVTLVCIPEGIAVGHSRIAGTLDLSAAAVIDARTVREIVVSSVEELVGALTPQNAGRRILVRAGTYALDHAVQVPDGAALIGEGVMQFDNLGLPSGFLSDGRTVLVSTSTVVGDFVTLGAGASLQDLTIQDVAGRIGLTGGGVVAVSSRQPGDSVLAWVTECEIINPNPPGIALDGPSGRGLVAITRNLNLGSEPSAHDDSAVAVHVKRSIIRSPAGGSGVFGINFAARSSVELHLSGNVIGGGLDVSGGVSRPDSVTGSLATVHSVDNQYRSDGGTGSTLGWNLTAGTEAPVPGIFAAQTTSNSLSLYSVRDRIEGFSRGVSAVAGRRITAAGGASSGNDLVLVMEGTILQTTASDLVLYGARSLIAGAPAGDDNVLRVLMRQVNGSGPRMNEYADSWNSAALNLGLGNRLEFEGTVTAFEHTTSGILRAPAAHFFTARR